MSKRANSSIVRGSGDRPRTWKYGPTTSVQKVSTLCSVSHHEKVPALEIRAGWRLERDLDASFDHFRLYWSRQIEALPDRACGRQQVICGSKVHVCISFILLC